jgi:hypothetical protein
MTYDINIRHRMCPTYNVVTYDVHTISSKRTMSYVQTTMSYGFHRRFWTAGDVHHIVYDMDLPIISFNKLQPRFKSCGNKVFVIVRETFARNIPIWRVQIERHLCPWTERYW